MFVSSEGLPEPGRRAFRPPSWSTPGSVDYVGTLAIPTIFQFLQPAEGPLATGSSANEGFESLTLAPDEQHLYTANERPSLRMARERHSPRGRHRASWSSTLKDGHYVAGREFPYPLEPVPQVTFTPRFMIKRPRRNVARSAAASSCRWSADMRKKPATTAGARPSSGFSGVSLDGATDVSGLRLDSRADGLVPVRKRLILDVNRAKGLPAELEVPKFDNFEGMCFGPALRRRQQDARSS